MGEKNISDCSMFHHFVKAVSVKKCSVTHQHNSSQQILDPTIETDAALLLPVKATED